jgi:adenine-specific DNA-methyltransferase
MASPKKPAKSRKRPIERYEHTDKKRANNPPVGLVTPETDPVTPTHKVYDYVQPVPTVRPGKELEYDSHLDPQLVWAGKKEHTSFEVPTVSLHVHEQIDPSTIIEAVRKRNGNGSPIQASLFERPEEKMPLRDAIDFYKHAHGWSNRLIAGDSLLVMNSLLEKEGMAGQVQMIYLDPPYGIKYGSNFQPFVNKRDVKDRKDEDLTQEPEMIRAFRDTWELGIHSYLSYLRDRMLLARELLHESGSCFVQISDENLHFVRGLLDEVFGRDNSVSLIFFKKTGGLKSAGLASVGDYLIWYAKNKANLKYRQLFHRKKPGEPGATQFRYLLNEHGDLVELDEATLRATNENLLVTHDNLTSQGNPVTKYTFQGKTFQSNFKPPTKSMDKLNCAGRLLVLGNTLRYLRRLSDFPYFELNQLWEDLSISGFSEPKLYVVQTMPTVLERCVLMTTDPGDLVFDPTCGSGTTSYVAEQWGRRWIPTGRVKSSKVVESTEPVRFVLNI